MGIETVKVLFTITEFDKKGGTGFRIAYRFGGNHKTITNFNNYLKNTNFTYTEFDPGTLADKAEIEHLDGLRILYEDAYMQHKDHKGFLMFLYF